MFKRKTSCFFDTFFVQFGLVWATRTDMQLHTCKVASVKERIRSKLRTARKSKRWSKADKGRSNPAICRSGARALLVFPDITLESGGNFWKSWKRKTKIAPFGRSNTCRVFGLFIELTEVFGFKQNVATYVYMTTKITKQSCRKNCSNKNITLQGIHFQT